MSLQNLIAGAGWAKITAVPLHNAATTSSYARIPEDRLR
jgi:hypothetical protein